MLCHHPLARNLAISSKRLYSNYAIGFGGGSKETYDFRLQGDDRCPQKDYGYPQINDIY